MAVRTGPPRFEDLVDDVEPLTDRDRIVHSEPGAPSHATSNAAHSGPQAAPPLTVEASEDLVEAWAPGVSTRTRAQLRRGEIPPQRELDLHGRTAHEARDQVLRFLAEARAAGAQTVLLIVGRGHNSGPAGPVLRDAVVELLCERHSASVLALCTAPARWGGAGALLVRLRRAHPATNAT